MSDRPTPTPEQVAHVFRELAEQRSNNLARASLEDDWRRVQGKWEDQVRSRTSSPWWMLQSAVSRLVLGPWAAAQSSAGRWVFSAVGAAAGVLLVVWLWPGAETLRYDVRSVPAADGLTATAEATATNEATVDGDWIRTRASRAALDFSDGSEVELAAHSVLNVDVVGKHSARTRLESGRLKATVYHADETDWVFVAGPYEVRVVGTSFDLSWQDSELSLVMHEGHVQVLGPDEKRWSLSQGQALRIPKAEADRSASNAGNETASSDTPGTEPPIGDSTTEDPADPTTSATADRSPNGSGKPIASASKRARPDSANPSDSSDPSSNWQAMLGKGRFDDILSQARARGIDSVLSGSSAAELSALAQAAGYSGKTKLAARTWKAIRSNHSKSSSARRGAFFLARLEERRGNNSEAVRWLDTYLREAPGGALAVEARGRKLVLVRRIHGPNSTRARAMARDYLERHPEGSYAETARATLGAR